MLGQGRHGRNLIQRHVTARGSDHGVAGLEAIIPVAPNTSYYHYYRSNGLVRHPGGYMGEDIDVLYDFIHSGNENFRKHCDCEVRDTVMAEGQDRVTGDYNAFWASRDYLNRMGPMKAALLMAHGFNDWNVVPEHSVRIYEAAKAKGLPAQFYCHQGGHGGDPPFDMMNRWFTRYLYGIENDVEKQPKSWIVREGADRESPTAYADYPHPDARPVKLHLTGEGQAAGSLTTAADAQPKKESLVDDATYNGATLAQAERSEHRLLFATSELKEPLHISGYPKISIRLASSKPAANLTVWLVSLPWNKERRAPITDNIITRGWADPQNHKSLTSSEPLTPGKFYELQFQLQPDDQVIPAGKQIGLMIFSSDPEFTLQPEPGTVLTIDLAHTSLELPIVGGAASFQQATQASANDARRISPRLSSSEAFVAIRCQAVENVNYCVHRLATVATACQVHRLATVATLQVHRLATVATLLMALSNLLVTDARADNERVIQVQVIGRRVLVEQLAIEDITHFDKADASAVAQLIIAAPFHA